MNTRKKRRSFYVCTWSFACHSIIFQYDRTIFWYEFQSDQVSQFRDHNYDRSLGMALFQRFRNAERHGASAIINVYSEAPRLIREEARSTDLRWCELSLGILFYIPVTCSANSTCQTQQNPSPWLPRTLVCEARSSCCVAGNVERGCVACGAGYMPRDPGGQAP